MLLPYLGKSMPRSVPSIQFRNGLLSRLTREQIKPISPHLERVALAAHKSLETRDRKIEYAYFVEEGLVSVVANSRDGNTIEIGVIGREGMTGIALLMNVDRSPLDSLVQITGSAHRISAERLRDAMDKNPGVSRLLTSYAHVFTVQAAFTALANGRHNVEERLSRWLLMAHDRMDGDEIPLTHALLAVMLGVRRPGVTVAINSLEHRGLIRSNRGAVGIIDRKGLEVSASGIYGRPESEYKRLLGQA